MSCTRLLVGDAFDRMAELPDASVDLIVTSPPFLALRSYLPADHPNKGREIGSEPTPAAFLSTLLALTREWRRLLAPHGSLCVELGDTYAGDDRRSYETVDVKTPHRSIIGRPASSRPNVGRGWPLAKSLCLIPSLYAGSLAYGHNLLDPDDRCDPWRIRNLIVWHRPNPPVGALGDKVRPSTSYITVGCVSDKRWFDLDSERTTPGPVGGSATPGIRKDTGSRQDDGWAHITNNHPAGAPPLDCWIDGDVWTIPTQPYKGAHYATYPIALPRRLINLMCPRHVCVVCGEPRRRITGEAEYVQSRNGGAPASLDKREGTRAAEGVNNWSANRPTTGDTSVIRTAPTLGWSDCGHDTWRRGHILDPFAGSGTSLAAAAETGRDATGIDIDDRNTWLVRERVGLFLEEVS